MQNFIRFGIINLPSPKNIIYNKLQTQIIVKMIKMIMLLVLCLEYSQSITPCQPFGLRLYYGDILIDGSSSQGAVVYFNTKTSCPKSFIKVLSSEGMNTIVCQHLEVQTSSFVNYYIAYIHKCSIRYISFEKSFSYIAYGWDQELGNDPIPHKNSWIDVALIDPRPINRQIKFIALADWGNIKKNIDIMTPITNDLNQILREQQIHVILINGDISYDLDSNNGTNYEEFLLLLEEFSTKIPIVHIPGNHQRKTYDAALLFNSSFKVYGLDKNLSSGLSLGSVYLIPFDPYNIIYGFTQPISSLDALKKQLQRGAQTGRFIIPCSHYPLICSGEYSQCYDEFKVLHEYFDAMIDNGVSLYVGAHTHSYQRNYPYFKDHSFLTLQSPYNAEGGYLISVLEGVGGNDKDILDVMTEKKQFTARYTVNETGFALIKSTKNHVEYSHFSTKQGFMDTFQIVKRHNEKKAAKRVQLKLNYEQQS